jgi:hypothetical protein
LQDWSEFREFLKLIGENNVRSYLEVGSKHGGSLWRIANTLPRGSRVVSVDLPHGDGSFKESQKNLEECIEELGRRGYEAHLFLGDSTKQVVIDQVRALAPFDLCLIDANHTEPYVRKDWQNYGPMARMVAFHDVGHTKPIGGGKMPIQVPKVWNEIKLNYRYHEIKKCKDSNGLGILWQSQPI